MHVMYTYGEAVVLAFSQARAHCCTAIEVIKDVRVVPFKMSWCGGLEEYCTKDYLKLNVQGSGGGGGGKLEKHLAHPPLSFLMERPLC